MRKVNGLRLLATIKPIRRELLRRENFRGSETVRLEKSLRKLWDARN